MKIISNEKGRKKKNGHWDSKLINNYKLLVNDKFWMVNNISLTKWEKITV